MAEGNREYNQGEMPNQQWFPHDQETSKCSSGWLSNRTSLLEHTGQINLGFYYFFFRFDIYSDELKQKTNINDAGYRLRYRFTVFPINENKVNCI